MIEKLESETCSREMIADKVNEVIDVVNDIVLLQGPHFKERVKNRKEFNEIMSRDNAPTDPNDR
jgi:hypothetical protein